ncbi:MAG: hypothetical protein GOU98_03960 [Candidatus Altiarchaeota archaeon]|nr:hypothetical protein [Candidatus Altiarchaeota archaeon]
MNKRMLKDYGFTFLFGALIFLIFFSWSLALGFPTNTSLNRASANTAFILIGLTYIIGPLSRKYKFFTKKMYYRKHLGQLGLLLVLGHYIGSLLIFSLLGLLSTFDAYFTGFLALLIFLALGIISNTYSMKKLGPKTWRRIQSWGYYGILLAFTHLLIKSWKKWSWWIQNPLSLPPTSLFTAVFWFSTFIIRTYFYTYLGGKKHITETND